MKTGQGHFPAPSVYAVFIEIDLLGLGFLGGSFFYLLALTALDHGVGHDGSDQADGADSVIVAGDGIIDLVGVAVGIGDSHNGNAQTM